MKINHANLRKNIEEGHWQPDGDDAIIALIDEITWFRTAQEAQLKRAEVDQKHILNLENTLQVYRDQNTWQYERIKFLEDAMGGAMITERRERERVKQLEYILQVYSNEHNYIDGISEEGTTAIDNDCGQMVRDALLEVDLDKA